MKKQLFLIISIAIFFLGTFLRFYQLDATPASLEWDEVSIGYNAFSILKTGHDEYGEFLPTTFKAFGEYKQPVYIYLDTLPIAAFGLNAFAVRFPSAFFGSISIILVYLLVFELFRKQPFAKQSALLSAAFFAISPWSIQFSRAAFEANVSLAMIIGGAWLFLYGLHKKQQRYFYSAIILFALSTYTYISAKLFVPFIFISLLIWGWKTYFVKRKRFVIIITMLLLVLSMLWVLDPKSISRSGGVIFTNQQSEILALPIQRTEYDLQQQDTIGSLFHNRRIVYAQTVAQNYLSHFDPIWLFFTGDSVERHHPPGMGQLYPFSLPFLLLGIFFLLTRCAKTSWPLFVWFLSAPIASALTFEAPHALRSLIFLPTWHIFEAFGVLYLLHAVRSRKLKMSLLISISIGYIGSILFFIHMYFVHTNSEVQSPWQYGYKEAMLSAEGYSDEGKNVIFAENFEQPYIFYLFYTQHNPEEYINVGGSNRRSEACHKIDTVYFGSCQGIIDTGDIYVALDDSSKNQNNLLEEVPYTTGEPAIRIYEYKKM